jgi:hypothetical protein
MHSACSPFIYAHVVYIYIYIYIYTLLCIGGSVTSAQLDYVGRTLIFMTLFFVLLSACLSIRVVSLSVLLSPVPV